MGNGCFCKNSNYIKDINLDSSCPMQPIVNTKSEQIIIKDEEENEKKKFNTLINYFNQSEKEIFNLNKAKKKEKEKKLQDNKKSSKNFNTVIDYKQYELMMERLLAQKNTKRYGPKRRETIRRGENINNLVKEILKENKEDIKKIEKETSNINHSIIIKNTKNKIGRFSVMYSRSGELINKINNK